MRRRGSIYVMVLVGSTIVAISGITGLSIITMQARDTRADADAADARQLALSAIELGVQRIRADSSWRSNASAPAWTASVSIGPGTASVAASDPVDSDLASGSTDPVILTGTGRLGAATQRVQVKLEARRTSQSALSSALHVAGGLYISGGDTLTVQGAPASSNFAILNDGTISGDAYAPAFAGTGAYSGSKTTMSSALPMPGTAPISYYSSRGTPCSTGSTVEKAVLSPASNPFGALNADGIYVISSASDITIRRLRLVGTLVVLAPGKIVTVEDVVLMEPARSKMPTLIIDGHAHFRFQSANALHESDTNCSLNPPGTPYGGASDTDTGDQYPCEIRGLVHVTGGTMFSESPKFVGSIICEHSLNVGAVSVSGDPVIIYDPALSATPPDGYAQGFELRIVPGTWSRVIGK